MMMQLGMTVLALSGPSTIGATRQASLCRNPAITACTPQLVTMVQRLSVTLDSLAGLQTPPDASAADRPTAVRFGTWLRDAAGRVSAQAAVARKSGSAPKPGAARANYFLDTVTLRNKLLAEADRFSFTSNGLKVRHDIAMNAIRNLK
jgi:hypothetical protein